MPLTAVGQAAALAVLAVLAVLGVPGVAFGADASAASGVVRASAPGNRVVVLASGGELRTALVHRPAWVGPRMALVVVLHGAGGNAEQAEESMGWDDLADRDGFVVAYPNGVGQFWNAGRCCGSAHRQRVDDVAFLHALMGKLVGEDGVNPRRVYAVGFSNGAMMAYAWACSRPGELAGIGVVAGALVAQCDPAPPLTVVALHGSADRSVPLNGGLGAPSVSHYRYPSLMSSLTPFLRASHCALIPTRVEAPTVVRSSWTCADHHRVTLIVVIGMGHRWPRSRSPRLQTGSRPGPVDATEELWTRLRAAGGG